MCGGRIKKSDCSRQPARCEQPPPAHRVHTQNRPRLILKAGAILNSHSVSAAQQNHRFIRPQVEGIGRGGVGVVGQQHTAAGERSGETQRRASGKSSRCNTAPAPSPPPAVGQHLGVVLIERGKVTQRDHIILLAQCNEGAVMRQD